jgi:ribosomal protein S18 acetylase RimI-like enzyme
MVYFKKVKFNAGSKPLLLSLQKICLPYDKPYVSADSAWWVGYDNKKPVAFCVISQSTRWQDTAYLSRSGVIPEYRGNGLQKRMITIREMYAKRKNYTWIISDTTSNPQSSNSLIRRGYQLFDPSDPWAYAHSLYWRKRIK